MPQNALPWTEEHEAYCYQHHIPPAAKILWQWLMRQGEISLEVEPDLSEFNTWVEKSRGKGYSHNYLKKMFELLCERRVIQVVKQYSWKIFRLLVRPLDWLKPPRKKREKNLQNSNSTYDLPTPNQQSSVDGDIQQQHSNLISNQQTLASEGLHFDESEKEVLDRPSYEIKVSIILFKIRGGFAKMRLASSHPISQLLEFIPATAASRSNTAVLIRAKFCNPAFHKLINCFED
jgi:hypothetical protein